MSSHPLSPPCPSSSIPYTIQNDKRRKQRHQTVYDLRTQGKLVAADILDIGVDGFMAEKYDVQPQQIQSYFIGSRNITLILPKIYSPSHQIVFLELYDISEKFSTDIVCTVIQKETSIQKLTELVLEKYRWKNAVICKDRRVLDMSYSLEVANTDGLLRLQAIRSCKKEISLVYQPKPKVTYTYAMNIDATSSIKMVMEVFIKEFADDMLVRNMAQGEVLHMFYHDMCLEDQTCIGIVLRGSKDKTLQFHISTENAISVTLNYREERGKVKVQKYQQISIHPNYSTADLRTEAAIYLNVDPKAIKLAVDNKRIEEVDNLSEHGVVKKGTILSVGTKKKKTIQVRHPNTDEEISVNLYMLETVLVLKQIISKMLDVEEFHMSLWCRGVEMRDYERLLNYPIKNKMEVTMAIHQFRISMWVVILFKRVHVKLVVDDGKLTTVDDVMTYCAETFRYNKRFSRPLFNGQCIEGRKTLAEIRIQQGGTLYITHFDEPRRFTGEMITVFQVRPDGQANPKMASICKSHLFYAPFGITLPQEDDARCTLSNGQVTKGICIDRYAEPTKLENQHTSIQEGILPESNTKRKSTCVKEVYLMRAKYIYQRKLDKEQTRKKLVALSSEYKISKRQEKGSSTSAGTHADDDNYDVSEVVTKSMEGTKMEQHVDQPPGPIVQNRTDRHMSEVVFDDVNIFDEDDIRDSDLFALGESDLFSVGPLNDLGSVSNSGTIKNFSKNLVNSESTTTDMNDSSSSQDKSERGSCNRRLAQDRYYNTVRPYAYLYRYVGKPYPPASVLSESPKSDDSSILLENFIPRPVQQNVLSNEFSLSRRESKEGYKTV